MLDGIRWVLFDAVGTLIYPDPPVANAYHAAGQQFGSRLSIDEICQRFAAALRANYSGGGPTSEAHERERWQSIVRQVMSDVASAREAIFDHLWEHFAQPHHWRLYDDVATTLSALRRRGFQLGIASNFDGRLCRIVDQHSALKNCAEVFVSSEVGFTKPDPRFFRAIEKRLNADPSQIALVGDDEVSDVQGAMSAGWRAVRLDRAAEASKSATIRTLAELFS
jgi:putative hydrolase of the HAD superfamily